MGSWIAKSITCSICKHHRNLLRSPLKEDKIIDSLLLPIITVHLYHEHKSSPGNQSFFSWSLLPSFMKWWWKWRWGWDDGGWNSALEQEERGKFFACLTLLTSAGMVLGYCLGTRCFSIFYEWAIYAASMEDLHLVENNGEWWGSASQGYRSDNRGPQWAQWR